jgi:hypothetical protein
MKLAGSLLAIVAALMLVPSIHAQQNLNLSGVRLWLERADAIRGPEGYGEDNYYTSYQIFRQLPQLHLQRLLDRLRRAKLHTGSGRNRCLGCHRCADYRHAR